MLEKLVSLKIPLAVIFSKHVIGNDVFLIVRKKDVLILSKKELKPFEVCTNLTGCLELTLERADINYFKSINSPKEWIFKSLGQFGHAYEQKESPFLKYIAGAFDLSEPLVKEPLTAKRLFQPAGTVKRKSYKREWEGPDFIVTMGMNKGLRVSEITSEGWLVWASEALVGPYPLKVLQALKDQFNSLYQSEKEYEDSFIV